LAIKKADERLLPSGTKCMRRTAGYTLLDHKRDEDILGLRIQSSDLCGITELFGNDMSGER
jgi:hypothetical protein